jgi:hypothetical protein
MIRHYLQLQLSILHRQMRAFGLAPVYAYPLATILFLGFSYLLFAKGSYAPYLYVGVALLPLSILAGKQRNDFLRICFRKKDFLRIRTLENLLFISPFLIYLLIEGAYLAALLLFVVGAGFLFLMVSTPLTRVLPTPFGKKPFEFPIGFRRYFEGFLLIYFVAVMGLRVDNFPLVAFTLGTIFALSSSFYNWVEPPYFVWHYHFREKDFLWFKLKTAVSYGSLLAAPLWISMLIFYPEKWWVILLIFLWGISFLTAVLLAKYSVFPRLASLPEALWLTVGLAFPPLLIWLNLYFYRKAKKNLKPLLT